ncbi:hypothetical protein Z043_113295 [Scleropages formosus]|uniref:Uncharacterized protein n=1 Tax=Scleropages formosus TaxID=113540 RepID=A0A0P7X1L9_SCLFO|nr:uncharacterized protein C13orf42 homolog [Scleropages formosus]KPP68054.1 hypothetical protein Z043_113295 [Scleropages formosus]
MFRKISAVFRPNHGHRSREGLSSDYHNACTVRLVRSTSMLIVGESRANPADSTLKRSKSALSIESTTALYYYRRQEDRIWLQCQNQGCLQYLEDLVALRRQYTNCVNNLRGNDKKATVPQKKKPPPPPPHAKESQVSGTKGRAPPAPSEADALQFFDAVIASCDPDPKLKPHIDDGNADVDFVVATSTSEHDLHSNWTLRDPRRFSTDDSRLKGSQARAKGRTVGERRQLQRNPIHLPKVAESAFHTLRFRPKLKKKD